MKFFKSKKIRAIIAMILVFSLLIGVRGFGKLNVYADNTVYAIGVVDVTSTLSLRTGAGVSNAKILNMPNGSVIYISNQAIADGTTWYYGNVDVNGSTYSGWCSGEHLSVTLMQNDSDYAATLKALGFPDTYIPYLTSLHAKYPSWSFQAVNVNLDWEYVVSKECVNKLNLVPKSANDSRKSTESYAYNYYTNTWTIVDGSSWVNASASYVKYRMDPRNYLNESTIFMFESSAFNATHTVEGVQSLLTGTWMATATIMEQELTVDSEGVITSTGADIGEVTYAQAIYDVCKTYGLNPYHAADRLRHEQGNPTGPGPLMSGTNENADLNGYYNAFNFGASGAGNATVISTGLTYAKNHGWNTAYKSIVGGVRRLTNDYIQRGQDTLYFQKFHVYDTKAPNSLFWHQYMQNVDAPYSEGTKLAASYTDKSQDFVFKIPVYKNMPATQCTHTDTGNPNNYLSSLTISAGSMNPSFDGAKTQYTATVPYVTTSVTISAKAVVGTSSVNGAKTYNLEVGENKIVVNCTAQNGTRKDYTITIRRASADEADAPAFSSSKYSLTEYITGIEPGTSVTDFVNTFTTQNCEVKVTKADGSANTGTIGTGDKIAIISGGTEIASYTTEIFGDVNGDGIINIIDLGMVDRYILNAYTITGINLKAADVNKDGNVNIIDLGMIDRQILNAYKITQ